MTGGPWKKGPGMHQNMVTLINPGRAALIRAAGRIARSHTGKIGNSPVNVKPWGRGGLHMVPTGSGGREKIGNFKRPGLECLEFEGLCKGKMWNYHQRYCFLSVSSCWLVCSEKRWYG